MAASIGGFYTMNTSDSIIHPAAIVEEGACIGARTRVWAFAHILSGVIIGNDCNICDHTFIENGVRLGDRVTLKCGVHLWSGLTAEDDVFIGPCVAFANDLRPRSKRRPTEYSKVLLKNGASLGSNCTILPCAIGSWAMIGAGSIITRDVPDYALVIGNPGRITGWVCRCASKLDFEGTKMATCKCGRKYFREGNTTVYEKEDLS